MRTIVTKGLRIGAIAAGLAFAGAASADPINVQFNINANGAFSCNTNALATATSCNTGAPNSVGFIQENNIGLAAGTLVNFFPVFLPLSVGGFFDKIFTVEGVGTFTENLQVLSVTHGNNVLGMLASGTISCSGGPCMFGGVALESTNVTFSVAWRGRDSGGL